MRNFLFLFLLLSFIDSHLYAQVEEEKLCIKNSTDQIYAIINKKIIEEINSGKDDVAEAYDDFLYHSQELDKHIDVKVKIYISSEVF